MKHPAVPGGKPSQQRAHRHAILQRLQGLVLGAELLVVGQPLFGDPGIQGDQAVGVCRVQCFQDLVLGGIDGPGDLGHGGGALELLGELTDHRAQAEIQLLEPPGHPYRPALVPEMALELSDDGRGGVGGELHLAVRVEPVDGLDQPDGAHLDKVVQRLPPAGEAPGQVLHQSQVRFDQPAADLRIAPLSQFPQEPLHLLLGQLRLPHVRRHGGPPSWATRPGRGAARARGDRRVLIGADPSIPGTTWRPFRPPRPPRGRR